MCSNTTVFLLVLCNTEVGYDRTCLLDFFHPLVCMFVTFRPVASSAVWWNRVSSGGSCAYSNTKWRLCRFGYLPLNFIAIESAQSLQIFEPIKLTTQRPSKDWFSSNFDLNENTQLGFDSWYILIRTFPSLGAGISKGREEGMGKTASQCTGSRVNRLWGIRQSTRHLTCTVQG